MKENSKSEETVSIDSIPERLQWTPELVEKFWNGLAYTRLLEMGFARLAGKSLVIAIEHFLQKGCRILDYGAGDGYLVKYLCERKLDATAFEPSAARSSTIQQLIGENRYFSGVINSGSSKQFDVVIMSEVIEHILDDDLDAVLNEVIAFIKNDGIFVVTTPNDEDLEMNMAYCPESNKMFHRWQHVRSFTDESLEHLLLDYGIEKIVTHKIDFNDAIYTQGDGLWGDGKNDKTPAFFRELRENTPLKLGSESNLLFIGRKK